MFCWMGQGQRGGLFFFTFSLFISVKEMLNFDTPISAQTPILSYPCLKDKKRKNLFFMFTLKKKKMLQSRCTARCVHGVSCAGSSDNDSNKEWSFGTATGDSCFWQLSHALKSLDYLQVHFSALLSRTVTKATYLSRDGARFYILLPVIRCPNASASFWRFYVSCVSF